MTIWAIISTASGGGDQGADPDKLVEITDPLNGAWPATGESFRTIRTAGFGLVLRGVSSPRGSGDGGSAPPVRWRRAHPAFPARLSAATAALLAVSPLLEAVGGRYFSDCNEADPVSQRPVGYPQILRSVARYALDPGNADRLWDTSVRLLS